MENDSDVKKVKILRRKCGTTDYERFTNSILSKSPTDLKFHEPVELLSKYFGEQTLLFSARIVV